MDPLRPLLYVLSSNEPDFTHIEEQGGWPSRPTTVSRPYAPLLEALKEDSVWNFRLTANPAHRATINGASKIVAHVTVAQQVSWLLHRQAGIGVDLGPESDPTFTLTGREVKKFRRKGTTVTLGMGTFDGQLRVVDPEALRKALITGIGRAKAYGCGLLTLTPTST